MVAVYGNGLFLGLYQSENIDLYALSVQYGYIQIERL